MNGHDRRAAFTREAIKDAFLDLLNQASFNYMTVASLCREAKVGRATFYTHFTGLTDVSDALADDALQTTARSAKEGVSGIAELAARMRETLDPEALAPYMNLLPVCQRVADNPKYRVLFTDPFVSEYVLMRIYRNEREHTIPDLMKNSRLSETEADKIFLFAVTGAFAVNRSMGWKKDEAWFKVQSSLLTFLAAGFDAVRKLS